VNKHEVRKAQPVASGVVKYFPDALRVVAHTSKVGNDQHNPGKPMHWAKEKSSDEADALLRHLSDHLAGETRDDDGLLHLGKVAWRALALLQRFLDANPLAKYPGEITLTETPKPKRYDDMSSNEKAAYALAKSREKYPDSVVVQDDTATPTLYRVRGGTLVGWNIYIEFDLDQWLRGRGWTADDEEIAAAKRAGLKIPRKPRKAARK
jgi:hypothetical protein